MSFWQDQDRERRSQEQLASTAYDTLQRTGESIQRSNQIAFETEQIGTEVLSELGEQRESLLRTDSRLQRADEDISRSGMIIRKLRREVLYNKIVLILIIIVEVLILSGILVIKLVK